MASEPPLPFIQSNAPAANEPALVLVEDAIPLASQAPARTVISSADHSLVPLTGSLTVQLPISSSAEPVPNGTYSEVAEGELDVEEDKKGDKEHKKRTKNWSRPETLLLIRLRGELAPRFGRIGRKKNLWDEIAEGLQKENFARDAQQCRYRWEKLLVRYKAVREGRKERRDNPYYDELHNFFYEKSSRRDREIDFNPFRRDNQLELVTQQAAIDFRRDLNLDGALKGPEKDGVPTAYPRKEILGAGKGLEKEKEPFRHGHEPEFGTQQLATDFRRGLNLRAALKHVAKDAASTPFPRKMGLGTVEDREKENNLFRRENQLEDGTYQAATELRRDLNLDASVKDAEREGAPSANPRKEDLEAGMKDVAAERTPEERPPMRKRKRGTKFVTLTNMHAVQTLLDTVISRQQRFFMDLLEAMERKEHLRERLRQDREEEWRAEERAQRRIFNNAMLVLTQRLVGERTGATMAPGLSGSLVYHNAGHEMPEKRSKSWKRAEVLQLMRLRGEMEDKFVRSLRIGEVWDELAEVLLADGIERDGKECQEKWDKMMSQYREVLDGKREQIDCPYFEELAALVGGLPEQA